MATVIPTFTYPTVTAGSWAVLASGDNTSASANGGTYASSGYVQLDKTKWASTITAVAASTPASGKVQYTIGTHSYAVGDFIRINGVLVSGSTNNTYNGVFTVTNVTSTTVAVSNSTTSAATVNAGSLVAYQWAPKGNLLNVIPQKDVLSIDVHRGRTRDDQACDVGTMTVVVDNRSGDYDVDNSNSPWQFPLSGSSNVNSLQRGMWGQLVYSNGSGLTKVFTGMLESCECDQGTYPTATLVFVDYLSAVGQAAIPQGFTGKAGVTSSTRIMNVLNAAGVLTPCVTYSGGAYQYTYPQLCSQITQNKLTRTHEAADLSGGALQTIEQIAASEGGRVFCAADGTFTVLSHADLPTAASTSAYTLSDAVGSAIEYEQVDTLPMHRQVVNQSLVTTPSNKTRQSRVPSSIARYGSVNVTATTTLSDDTSTTPSSSLQALADFLASRRAQPSTAFAAVRFQLRGLSASTIGTVVGTDLASKITVTRTSPAGVTTTAGCWIEGIDLSLTPDSWSQTVYTSAIDNPASTY